VICNGRERRERLERELLAELNGKKIPFWMFKKRQPALRAGKWETGATPDFDRRVLLRHGLIDEFGPSHTSTLEGKRRRGSV
jgi:hypothetical protein